MNIAINRYWWLLAIAVVILPMAPMSHLGASFDGDWYIHLWFAGYFGQYFKVHHFFPAEINSYQVLGLPTGVFYSYILNPILGFLSIFVGPQIAVRLLTFTATYLQFLISFKLTLNLTKDKVIAFVVSTILVWAIYPWTNIFNRAAIPEFFATTFLTCSICAWLLLLTSSTKEEKIRYAITCTLFTALALGTHPITALYSTTLLAVVCLITLLILTKPKDRRQTFLFAFGIFIILAVFLSPWIYANLMFMNKLDVSKFPGLSFMSSDVDAWWTRFQILPFDKRSLLKGQMVDTNYLDTQINMPLLFLVSGMAWLTLIWKNKKSAPSFILFYMGGFLFLLTLWMSLSITPYSFFPNNYKIVQIAYRLISYQNISLFLMLIALMLSKPVFFQNFKTDWKKTALITFCLTASFLGAVEKFTHSMVARNPQPKSGFGLRDYQDSIYLTLSPGFNFADYFTDELPYKKKSELHTTKSISFGLADGPQFGQPLPVNISVETPAWFSTNVGAFKWNRILVNNVILPVDKMARSDTSIAVWLDKGTYELQTRFEPPATWRRLRDVSYGAFMLCLLGSFIVWGLRFKKIF